MSTASNITCFFHRPKYNIELVNWKQQEETTFLKEVHSQILQQKLMDLDQALQEAFDKTTPKQFPRFKKRGLSTDQGGEDVKNMDVLNNKKVMVAFDDDIIYDVIRDKS